MADGIAAQTSFRPLTEPQEGLWYFQALDPKNPILNVGQYLDLTGNIDEAALMAALRLTLDEAQALRLRFASTPSGPVQWLDDAPLQPQLVDLSAQADPAAEATRLMWADTNRPVDLAREPTSAFVLYKLREGRYFLYERIHHLSIDGYGIVLVSNRIGEHYNCLIGQGPTPLAFPQLSRADDEDSAWRASPKRAEAADWWKAKMAGLPEVQGPMPGRAISGHSFLREDCHLPHDVLARLQQRSDALKLGWPDVLTALTGAWIARWTAGEAVIGLPFMARMGRKIARLPCMAMNVLPQRVTPNEDQPLDDWLRAVVADLRETRKYGLYRSEQLRRDLGLVGGGRRLHGPLVNVQPFDKPPVFAGLQVGLHILSAGAVDDLTFTFRGDPQSQMLFEVDANPALYALEDVRDHSEGLIAFLDAALQADRLADVLTASPKQIAWLDAQATATRKALPDTTLVEMIEAQIAATPDAPALTFGDTTLSYAELDRRSQALAAKLAELGAGREKLVAVAMDRSIELSVALLAAMRAGAGYLPLDPDHPPERLARILEMAGPVVLLTTPELAGRFPAGTKMLLPADWPQDGRAPDEKPLPDSLAYVIYTSGSTGEPKGVMIEQRAIVNRLWWMRDFYGVGAGDRILQKTPATFDVSVWEFFLPYLSGAELVMAPPQAHRDPSAIAGLIRQYDITTLHFVPSMLSAFLASPASEGIAIKRTFCSGEELTADQRQRFHARIKGELHNLYGPTEAAVDVSFWDANPQDRSNPLPIGYPVWNTRLEVLDDRLRPVPPGLPGNLYLGGVQLARGYLGRPDLTEQRFIPHPRLAGERLYATGDVARMRRDGAVVYLGRSDNQVKIRGLRIELGEIETAIMASGLARECVVMAREDHAGEKRLVTYLVPTPDYSPGMLPIRLCASLPSYMVPAAEVVLDALPVTSNGKLDRKALPAPEFASSGRAAQSATEQMLARLFAELLHLPDLPSAEGDFFALGGDSLGAVRLCLRIAEETGRDPGLGAVFENAAIDRLAEHLDKGLAADQGTGPVLTLAEGPLEAEPLFVIHPAGGLSWCYRTLGRLIAPQRTVYGLQHPGLSSDHAMPDTLADLAADYVERVVELVPDGPIHLAGWSVGGLLAHAMAVELEARGRQLGVVALLDSYPADAWRDEPVPSPVEALRALLAIAGYDPDAHSHLDSREKIVAFLREGDSTLGSLPEASLDGVVRVVTDTNRLVRGHQHRRFGGRITHIRATLDHVGTDLSADMWRAYAAEIDRLEVPFLHAHMASPEASLRIAPELAKRMD